MLSLPLPLGSILEVGVYVSGILSSTDSWRCSLCLMEPLFISVQSLSMSQWASEVSEDGWGWGGSGICKLQVLINELCWSRLPAGGLPAGCLEKLRWVGEGYEILPETKGLQAGLFSWEAGYPPPGLLMQLQSVSQRSSEVAGDFGFGNSLGLKATWSYGRGEAGWSSLRAGGLPPGQLVKLSRRGRGQEICQGTKGLEIGVSSWVTDHSTLGLNCHLCLFSNKSPLSGSQNVIPT